MESIAEKNPSQAMQELRDFLSTQSQSNILLLALGIPTVGVPPSAQHLIVNAIDCESYEHDHKLLTEIGLSTFDSSDIQPLVQHPGPHAENILKETHYYHLRILKNAHCINRMFCPGNPENNRFGTTRFVTDDEAKQAITDAFRWPIDRTKPELGSCPVIFLGHAIHNDSIMLHNSIDVNVNGFGTVVATIDTQRIAAELGIRGRGDKIGLAKLCDEMGFGFRDGHTAGNDAAYTMISAVMMVLRDKLTNFTKSAQAVIHDVEKSSQINDTCSYGIGQFCTRCSGKNHFQPQCRKKVFCKKCDKAGRNKAFRTHTTAMCSL